MQDQAFEYRAVNGAGAKVSGVVSAADRNDAVRRLSRDGLLVTEIAAARTGEKPRSRLFARTGVTLGDRILVLRQLALLTNAGIDLLDALETVAEGLEGKVQEQVRTVAGSLRKGDKLSVAFRKGAPGYPDYVYALISAGEASGELGRVLDDSASLLAFDDRVRRDVATALTYPSFLIVAGLSAVGFLFYEVVPRFADMIGDGRSNLTGFSAMIIGAGEFFRANAGLVLGVIGGLIAIIAVSLSRPEGRRWLNAVAHRTPVIGNLLMSRERAIWARIMSLAVGSGVGILDAVELAGGALPPSRLKQGLASSARSIRAGKPVDVAFGEPGVLHRIDRSLLRAGQKSGQLAAMFGYVGQRYEDTLRDDLKRATTLVEPLAIGLVAVAIGAVAVGLVSAMSSVYETIL